MTSLPTPNGRIEMRSNGLPLHLLEVNKFWKWMAETTPGLWTTITVRECNMHSNGLLAMRAWLARSGSALPISISFDPANVPQTIVDIIVNTIKPFSPRLRRLSLPVDFAAALLHPGIQLSSLETIGLYMSKPGRLFIPPSAKRLRNAIVMLGPLFSGADGQLPVAIFRPIDVHITWEQLRHLTLGYFDGSTNSLPAILRRCPNLSFLCLDRFFLSPESVNVGGHQSLGHSGLRSLRIVTDGDASSLRLLRSLNLPNLMNMHIDFRGSVQHEAIWSRLASHIAFFAWRTVSFQQLTLGGFNVSEDELMWLSLFLPSVNKISAVCDGNDLITAAAKDVLTRHVNSSYVKKFAHTL